MPRRWMAGVLVAVAAILLVGRFASGAYVDYLWYHALGADEIWAMRAGNQILLSGGSGAVAILFLALNLLIVRRSVVSLVLPRRIGNLEIGEEVPGRYLTRLAIGAATVVGAFLAIPPSRWLELASARYGVLFRERDPYFNYDLSFFVHWVPLERMLFNWCLALLVVTTAISVALYALTPSLRWSREAGLLATMYVRRHTGVLFALALLLLAWSIRLEMYGSLVDGSGVASAFTSVDRAMIRFRSLLSLMTIVSAALVAWSMWSGQLRLALFAITAVILSLVGVNTVMPLVLHGSAELGENLSGENQYEAVRAGRSRRAYASQDVLPAEPVAVFSLDGWSEALQRVPVWDSFHFRLAASRMAGGSEPIGEVTFEDSEQGAKLSAVVASRESGDQSPSRAWHIVRALASVARADGSLRAAPFGDVAVSPGAVAISHPGPGYVLVVDSLSRLPAPALDSWLARLTHAWSRQDLRLLFGESPEPHTRIVQHADTRSRIQRVVPFFTQDQRIFPIMANDSLNWVVHLYSSSVNYPLSQPMTVADTVTRYFRHAGTATVNAATGRLTIYMAENQDPIAATWADRFPETLRSSREIPSAIATNLPPPLDAILVQSEAFARYGARHDSELGGRVATLHSDSDSPSANSYALLQVPPVSPFPVWTVPLLDKTDRIRYLLMAVGGSSPRTFTKEVAGPNADWSSIRALFQSAHDSVAAIDPGAFSSGPLIAFAVDGRLILAMSTFEFLDSGTPFLRAVTAVIGDSVRTAATLSQAVGASVTSGTEAPLTLSEYRERAIELYEGMQAALRRGDLAAFAALFEELGSLLSGGD